MIDIISTSAPLYCSIILGLAAAYLLIASLSQYWRLRNIPGPPLAKWTNAWLMWHMHRKETFHTARKRLHEQYGPIQRYGPTRVMFSDPTAVPVILGSTNIYAKVPFSYMLAPELTP